MTRLFTGIISVAYPIVIHWILNNEKERRKRKNWKKKKIQKLKQGFVWPMVELENYKNVTA